MLLIMFVNCFNASLLIDFLVRAVEFLLGPQREAHTLHTQSAAN